MSESSGLEIFERAVDARGQLLRVEADGTTSTPRALVLTFDVGRIMLHPDDSGLGVTHVEARGRLPAGLVPLDEVEPWWRLMGQPLTAAWPGGVEDGVGARGLGDLLVLKLRFREPSENPRIIQIEAAGRALRVSLEPDP